MTKALCAQLPEEAIEARERKSGTGFGQRRKAVGKEGQGKVKEEKDAATEAALRTGHIILVGTEKKSGLTSEG